MINIFFQFVCGPVPYSLAALIQSVVKGELTLPSSKLLPLVILHGKIRLHVHVVRHEQTIFLPLTALHTLCLPPAYYNSLLLFSVI